jgi:hypothetical protein
VTPLFSGSRFELAHACPASQVLPQAQTETGAAAARGTVIHAYLEQLANGAAAEVALAAMPEELRDVCSTLPAPPPGSRAEVTYAVNWRTGVARRVGHGLGRDYSSLSPDEVPLTLDLERVAGEEGYVGDYKTGRTELPPAARNLQLRLGAYALSQVEGLASVTVELIHIEPDGRVWVDGATLDAIDLDSTAGVLRETCEEVVAARDWISKGGIPNVRQGAHCRWCPARMSCPARTSLVRAMAEDDVAQRIADAITPANAGRAYALLEACEQVLADLRAQLILYATENPISLPGGKVFGPVEVEREVVRGDAVHGVMARMHGLTVADMAVELSATKSSIERALKTVAKKGELARMKREVFGELEAVGGIEVKRSTTVKAHNAHNQEQ